MMQIIIKKYRIIKLILIVIIICMIITIFLLLNNKSQRKKIEKVNEKIINIYENTSNNNDLGENNLLKNSVNANEIKTNKVIINSSENIENSVKNENNNKKIDDWRLILVNFENSMPLDFQIQLVNIDKYRKIDERVYAELMQMIKDMKKDGASNIWIQSAYRSIEKQEKLYYDRVNEYIKQGKTQEEAEILVSEVINKPKTSEHNLGLAVDFNYINYNFEKTKEYKWLTENAQNYGFILRYPKDKQEQTKIDYEPWHWRYVGVEHAKKINELEMCLEEYVEYLINENI